MQIKTRIKFSKGSRQILILSAILIMAFISSVMSAAALPAAQATPLDFTAYTLSSYGGAQDSACGSAVIEDAGATLHINGNCWKKIDFAYNITPNTIVEFDFQSSVEGEIHGIGFDTDDTIDNPIQIFQLYGTQTWGLTNFNDYAGETPKHYTIPVGQFYTGNMLSMTFANDDDAGLSGESIFSNVQVYEGTPPPPPMLTVNGSDYLVESYGGTQDGTSTVTIEDGGLTLRIVGNGWKKVAIPYNVTANTVLEFDFSSDTEGEIHGIGFDVDDTIDNPIRIFQLSGTQTYGDQSYNTYITGSGLVHYSIPVGTFYTGSFLSLTFTNDHDVAVPNGESVFSNIVIHEQIDLYAVSGTKALPDQTIPVWGYNSTNAPVIQPGGPTLIVNEGDTVDIVLHNEIGEDTALFVHGQNMIPDLTGVATGASKLYTITANQPGTYLYEAGLLPNAQHQVAMGLYGILIVRPTTAGQAYNDPVSAYDDEAVLLLSEIDPALNTSVDPSAFDMRDYKPTYWLINGQVYPDTQTIPTTAGNKVLLRYVNAGLQHHTMSLMGLDQMLVAEDGYLLPYQRSVVAETIMVGQTRDMIVDIPATTPDGSQIALYNSNMLLHNNNAAGFGGMMTFITTATGPAGPDVVGPTTSAVTVTPSLTNGAIDVSLTATVSDVATGNANVVAAEYYIDDTGGTPTAMSGAFGSPTENVSATILAATVAGLSPGDHTIYVRGQDALGNWGSFNVATLRLELSGSGPTTKGLTLTHNPTAGDVDVLLSGTADDSATGNSNIVDAEFWVGAPGADGSGTHMAVNVPAPIASIDYTIPASTFTVEGVYTINVHSQDDFLLWGSMATIDLEIDLTGPDTSNVMVAPNPNNGSLPINPSLFAARLDATISDPVSSLVQSDIYQAEFFINDTCDDGTGIPMYAKDGVFDSPTEDAYALISLININALGPGSHTISVHGRDNSGNWGPCTDTTLVIDQGLPIVTGTDATPNPTAGANTVSLTAVGTDGASTIDAAEWFVDADPGPGNGTPMTLTPNGGNWDLSASIDVSTWAVGNYTLYVRVHDIAGNWSATDSVVLDVTSTAAAYGVSINPTADATSGTPGSTVTYILNVTNDGNIIDTFDVAVTGNAWTTTAPLTVGPLAGGATGQISVDVTVPGTAVSGDSDVATVTVTSQGDNGQTAVSTLTTSTVADLLYFSTTSDFAVPGVGGTPDDADIYSWDGTSFSRIFDASAAGLPGNADIDAMKVVDADTFYMSFTLDGGLSITGIVDPVDDEDIVLYDAGTWSLYFDATEAGFGTNNGEDVDAFEILPDGSLLLSALGIFNTDPEFPSNMQDEDIVQCIPAGPAPITSCTAFNVYFDGSDAGFGDSNGEDINGVSVSNGTIYLSTVNGFSVAGLSGGGSDVIACNGPTTGTATSCTSFSMYFDGSVEGVTDQIDAIDLP
ncbi:MAG: multicopper oxidase domain-containing protein [Anaerolineales bacterium]|nr:multicopper oxidase domain-containing protein [Anaerolineales bacterium]